MFSKSEIIRLKEYKRLALAVSGGKDSMAMLYWFIDNREKLADNFFVINIEHGIRGGASQRDSAFVKDYCAENGVECIVEEVDVPAFCSANGLGLEQGARILRHKAFQRLIDEEFAQKIVVAHHLNDQAESILMHIFRGTGIKGLVGMQKEAEYILRPFLDINQAEIDAFVEEHSVPYVQDETNFDSKYTRNFLRNQIIPLIEEKYPNFLMAMQRLSNNASEVLDFTSQFVSNQIDKNSDGSVSIRISALQMHPALVKINLLKCFEALGIYVDIEERHLLSIVKMIDMPNGSSLDMPFEIMVCKEYEDLVFAKKVQAQAFSVPFNKTAGENLLPDGSVVRLSKVEQVNKQEGVLFCDLDKIADGCVLRTMRLGDTFKKFNGKTKKLCDFLTDKKIPKRLRHNLIVLAKDDVVLAVVGCEIADEIKVDTDTNNIYSIKLRRK